MIAISLLVFLSLLGVTVQFIQIKAFLIEHEEPILKLNVFLIYITIFIALILPFVFHQWQGFALVCMFLTLMPLFFLDLYKHWLPLRFTNSFWAVGVLISTLPCSTINISTSIISSAISFCVLHFVYLTIVKIYGYEALGRGDIHFISALFAWLPVPIALYCIGSAFLLMALFLSVKKGRELPYAPFMIVTVSAYRLIEVVYSSEVML